MKHLTCFLFSNLALPHLGLALRGPLACPWPHQALASQAGPDLPSPCSFYSPASFLLSADYGGWAAVSVCEVSERSASLKWRLSHEVVQGRAGWGWVDEEKLRAQSQMTP